MNECIIQCRKTLTENYSCMLSILQTLMRQFHRMYFNLVMHDNCHHRASTVLALTSGVATTRLNRDDKAVAAAAKR